MPAKNRKEPTDPRPMPRSRPGGAPKRAVPGVRRRPSEGVGAVPRDPADQENVKDPTTTDPPQGLDAARHAAAQRAAHQAEVLRKGVFPALMATALGLDKFFETAAYKVFLEQVLAAAGNPADPIERMLVEQTCLVHFRVAQLHVGASQAAGVEAVRVYNAAAARLLGEMRRTALALRAYRTHVPEGKPAKDLKIFKAAQ